MKKKDKLSRKRERKTELNKAIEDLFDYADYDYIHQGMWEWMKATICGDFSTRMDSQEKDFTLILFEKVNRIIKAAHDSRERLEDKNTIAA